MFSLHPETCKTHSNLIVNIVLLEQKEAKYNLFYKKWYVFPFSLFAEFLDPDFLYFFDECVLLGLKVLTFRNLLFLMLCSLLIWAENMPKELACVPHKSQKKDLVHDMSCCVCLSLPRLRSTLSIVHISKIHF